MTAYEMGQDSFKVVTGDLVNVHITSNITSFTSEKRFDKSITVVELKAKLELICGATAGAMVITVYDKDGKQVCGLEGDDAIFGSFPVDDGMRLHVEDSSKVRGEFENVDSVQKFELDKAEYSKRTDTVQAYLKKNKLGKYNAEEMAELAREKEEREEAERVMVKEKGIVEGARAEVAVQGAGKRRGTVRYWIILVADG
jgi:tubulin-folding cofactor B